SGCCPSTPAASSLRFTSRSALLSSEDRGCRRPSESRYNKHSRVVVGELSLILWETNECLRLLLKCVSEASAFFNNSPAETVVGFRNDKRTVRTTPTTIRQAESAGFMTTPQERMRLKIRAHHEDRVLARSF